MRIENDYRLIERLAKKNRRRRLLKRGLALLSAVVLLVTANTLKRKVVAMEHRPTCGWDYEHVHDEACFDEAGNLICSLHEHTDACFQEAPVPEEEELDLSLFDDEDLTDIDDAQAALAANVAPTEAEPEAPLTYEFDMAGGAQATLSEVLEATGLPVDRAQIQMVGLVDDANLGNDPIAIALVDGDLTITALQAFEAVEIAIVTEQDEILTVTLLNGAPEAADEEPTEVGEETEPTEDIEQNIDADATDIPEDVENVEENIEENTEENVEENTEENEEDIEDVTEENVEENIEQNVEENVEENTADDAEDADETDEDAEAVEAVEAVEQADATDDAQQETEEEQTEVENIDGAEEADATEQKEQTEVENSDEAAETTEEVEEDDKEQSESDEAEETEEASEEESKADEAEEETKEESKEESEEETKEESEEESKEEAEEESEKESAEAEAEEEEEAAPELTPEELLAALYPAQSFEAHAENVRVDVTAEVGAFPAGTEMRVSPVWDTDTLDGIAGTVAEDFVEVKKVLAVDIAFFNADGEEIEPLLPISVVMTVEEEIEENQDAVVVHMDDDGNAEVVEQSGLQADDQLALNVEMPAAEDAEAQTEQILAEAAEAIAAGAAEEVAQDAETEAAEDADEAAEAVENTDDATETVADEVENTANVTETADEDVPAEQPSIEYGSEDEDAAPAPAAEALEVVAEAAPTQSVAFEADAFSVYAVVVTETIETRYIAADGARFTITVGYGPEAEIPAGAELAVEEIAEGSEAWQGYFDASQAAVSDDDGMIRFARFFDIEIVSEGEKVEPAAPVEVKISYDDPVALSEGEALSVVHFADEGTEVISDLQLSDDATEITYQQASFSVTGTVIQTPVVEHYYAMVIPYQGRYYVVENDGTLTYIKDEDIVFNNGAVQTVMMVNPICWTYKASQWENNFCIYHNTTARAFDWYYNPAKGKMDGSSLPTAYTRRYLTVDKEEALVNEDDNIVEVDRIDYSLQGNGHDGRYLNLQYNSDSHKINHYGNYLGVKQDSDGTLRICGLRDSNNAAEVFFAEAQKVLDVNVKNHTVNHIDISVEGKASIKVPLDYGSYRLATIDNMQYLDSEDLTSHIHATDRTLEVVAGDEITLEAERTIPVDDNDLKKAGLTAYTTWENGTKHYRDDVYNIIGYSRNAETNSDTKQVRLEGRFKVSDLEPLPSWYDTEDKANNWNYWENGADTGKQIKQVRLERPIYYSISITKPATFTMTYTIDGQTYVVLDENGNPMRRTVDVTLAKTFSYWDIDNACPGLGLYSVYNTYDEVDFDNSKQRWREGELCSNENWNRKVLQEQGVALDGGPGMDFRLSAEVSDETNHIVAIQVTKYVQGIFGENDVRMLKLADGTSCAVDVYQNGDTNPEHRLDVSVTTDGMGMIFDWDVEGGTYENPATVKISEDPESVEGELVDNNGRRWVYVRSRVETEVAERHDGQPHPDRYEKGLYTKDDAAFYSDEEVLGQYTVYGGQEYYDNKGTHHDGYHEFNRVEEFFIYNIYKPKTYPVRIKKIDAITQRDDGLKGAEFDLYGPYTDQEVQANGFEPVHASRKWNDEAITTGESGLAEVMDLETGHYFLVETKAPAGYNMMTSPVAFSVDSKRETDNATYPITYRKDANTLEDSVSWDESTGTFIFTVTNNPGVRLPSTGGSGTGAYTFAGAAMALIALALLIAKRREAR